MSTRTWIYRTRLALDDLALVERPVPVLGAHDVLLRLEAASLNYRDLAIARAAYPGVAAPLVPGSDAAGEVIAVGAAVTRVRVGERACAAYVPDWIEGPPRAETSARRLGGPVDGVLAELLRVDERALVRAPRTLSPIEAATLPVAGVAAWQALVVDGGLAAGQTVAVSGAGGAGLLAVQIARALGAEVIVVGRDAGRLARVAALGARTVDASRTPAWDEEVRAMTDGRGVDLFVDGVGGDWLGRAIGATRVGGAVSLFGFAAGARATIDLVAAIRRSITLRATSGGSRASLEALVRFVDERALRPIIDRRFPFTAVPAALAWLADRRPFGKVVVTP